MIHLNNNTYTDNKQLERHGLAMDQALEYAYKKRLERMTKANKAYHIDLALAAGVVLIVLIYVIALA